MNIDSKYNVVIRGMGTIRVASIRTGELIPPDEPLMLFRARDRHALSALQAYQLACERAACTPQHMKGIKQRLEAFETFRNNNPSRMKQPGLSVEVKGSD